MSQHVDQDADGSGEERQAEVFQGFAVNSDETANWVVRKIVEARAYHQRCADWCAREQTRAKRTEEFFLWRFGNQLRCWLDAKLVERGGRTRSINLPAGTVGLRRLAARLVIDDETAVLEWAKSHQPQLVVVTEKVSKSALSSYVSETGEMPSSGARVESAQDSFYVK
jgi:hypothetical protein